MKKNVATAFFPIFMTVLLSSMSASDPGTPADGGGEYDVRNIPADLMEDAGALVRKHLIHFEVKNDHRAKEKVTIAVTIFRMDKRNFGSLTLWYDKFREIDDLDGVLYDADGTKIRFLSKDDVKDLGSFEQVPLYSDSRVRTAEMYYDRFPYTVEFSYELSYDGFVEWPTWYTQTSLDPVQLSRFEVVMHNNQRLRYLCNNDSLRPDTSVDGDVKTYVWQAANLKKLSPEVYGDGIEDVAGAVHIGPTAFELDGFKGNMDSWRSFGAWGTALAEGRDKLPEAAARDVRALLQPNDNNREKVERIYRYMQSRTRYVSVQLGIGGWQPFDASYVHERGYGDCKALSNYMVSLLREANVPAYSVWIENGTNPDSMVSNFPRDQFNHVIVCVPQSTDSLWLECTSQSISMGHIGMGNENRQALLIGPAGGVVVRTPPSSSDGNRQWRIVMALLFADGSATVSSTVQWTGDQLDYVRNSLDGSSPKEREDWIVNSIDIPNVNLKSYTINGVETGDSLITMHANMYLPKYGSSTGNRLFIQPNMMERRTYVPPDVAHRFSPVRFSYPYIDKDSVYLSIPVGYKVEALPPEANLQSWFAKFSSKTVSLSDTALIFQRSLDIETYSIPPQNYSEYRNFFSAVVRADRAQVVLVRKN